MLDVGIKAERLSAAGNSAELASQGSEPDKQKLRQASEDFEALLIGQMLQSMRESALSGWQETEDQSGAIALEMAESQLARMMATSGGLGLARTLRNSLQREPAASGS